MNCAHFFITFPSVPILVYQNYKKKRILGYFHGKNKHIIHLLIVAHP